MTLSLARLAEAEKVIAKATPGPWTHGHSLVSVVQGETVCRFFTHDESDFDNAESNAAFIAMSRTLLPDLIALVQALGTLGPDIEKRLDIYGNFTITTTHEDHVVALLRQVQALIPKGE